METTQDSSLPKITLQEVKQPETAQGTTEADFLVTILLEKGIELIIDQFGQPSLVDPGNPLMIRKINSKFIKQYLARVYWEAKKTAIGSETISKAATTLQGIAFYKNIRKTVYNRVAQLGNNIFYDVGDDKHIVKITPDNWEVKTTSPVHFRRFSHQRSQVLPQKGGDLKNINKYFNISEKNQEILLTTYLPTCLLANIARPLLLLHGPQGSGKSMALELIRLLIDPSITPLLTTSAEEKELIQQADHHYCYFLDNVSKINDSLSDNLCKLVTGGAFSKRELYTDDEDILYCFKRVTGFNGVAQFANKPDLLDRSIILQFERISNANRKREEELRQDFEKELPLLIGSLFDSVSNMLKIAPTIKLSKYPRMADYYLHAMAVSEFLGYGRSCFEKAYDANIDQQNLQAIEASVVSQTIIQFMEKHNDWTGNSTQLFSYLQNIAVTQRVEKGFPKNANWLWRKIQEAQATLNSVGIKATRDRNSSGRQINLSKNNPFDAVIADNTVKSSLEKVLPSQNDDSKVSNVTKEDPCANLVEKVNEIMRGEKHEAKQ